MGNQLKVSTESQLTNGDFKSMIQDLQANILSRYELPSFDIRSCTKTSKTDIRTTQRYFVSGKGGAISHIPPRHDQRSLREAA